MLAAMENLGFSSKKKVFGQKVHLLACWTRLLIILKIFTLFIGEKFQQFFLNG
jgi:hypothetical protein